MAFTTEALKYTRLRLTEKDNWEALLPGLSGGQGTYVVPWGSLPEMISLSLHDRALFDLVKSREDTVPASLRRHLISVQSQGYDGPDKAIAAQTAMGQEKEVERYLLHKLIVLALEQYGDLEGHDITQDMLANPNSMAQAHKALDAGKSRIGLIGEEQVALLSEWVLLALPIGSSDGEAPGYLFRLLQDIAAFTGELTAWAEEESAASAAMANQVVEALTMTGRLAMETAEKVHLLEQDVAASLQKWPETRKLIHSLVSRTSWLLDGWDRLMELWYAEEGAPRFRQREVVVQLVQNLPVLPEEALNANQMIIWQNYRQKPNQLGNHVDPRGRRRSGSGFATGSECVPDGRDVIEYGTESGKKRSATGTFFPNVFRAGDRIGQASGKGEACG